MPSICLCSHIHLPVRLKTDYSFFDIGINHFYEDEIKNRENCIALSRKYLIPEGKLVLKLINKYRGRFKISFSVTGTAVEQLSAYCPEVIELLQQLAATGCVEFAAETYSHSLAFLYSKEEFLLQTEKHITLIKELFSYSPVTFRNTSLMYNNAVAETASAAGLKNILADIPEYNLPRGFLFSSIVPPGMNLLLKHSELSGSADLQFFDYETLRCSNTGEPGVLGFSEQLINKLLENENSAFICPCEASSIYSPEKIIDIKSVNPPGFNSMEKAALNMIYKIKDDIIKADNPGLTEVWRKLQDAEHFENMNTENRKFIPDYFKTPYDAFVVFANIANDLNETVKCRLNK